MSLDSHRTRTGSFEDYTPPSAMTPNILSPSPTVVDLTSQSMSEKETLKTSPPADGAVKSVEGVNETVQQGAKIKLPQRKKWALLAVFSLAMFVDSELLRTSFH